MVIWPPRCSLSSCSAYQVKEDWSKRTAQAYLKVLLVALLGTAVAQQETAVATAIVAKAKVVRFGPTGGVIFVWVPASYARGELCSSGCYVGCSKHSHAKLVSLRLLSSDDTCVPDWTAGDSKKAPFDGHSEPAKKGGHLPAKAEFGIFPRKLGWLHTWSDKSPGFDMIPEHLWLHSSGYPPQCGDFPDLGMHRHDMYAATFVLYTVEGALSYERQLFAPGRLGALLLRTLLRCTFLPSTLL